MVEVGVTDGVEVEEDKEGEEVAGEATRVEVTCGAILGTAATAKERTSPPALTETLN
jgi:hypothetical protein